MTTTMHRTNERRAGLTWKLGDELPGRVRTEAIKRGGVSGSAATICQCGGLLAEDGTGQVWCLKCETQPARRRPAR